MKILFVDDHSGLRESLSLALQSKMKDFNFMQAGSGNEAKKLLLKNKDCSVLLLDLQLGMENGLSILCELPTICPKIKTLVCTAFYEPLKIETALKLNVQGFITKTADLKEIAAALETVANGNEYFCKEALSVMKSNFKNESGDSNTESLFARYKTLSPKEKEIFENLAAGLDVFQIAQRLGKSVKTVENQRTAVYAKMDIHDRFEAVEASRKLGIEI